MGGRPRKNEGTRAARRMVQLAREKFRRAQVEAAEILIAGMRGQLPPELSETMMSSAKAILNRGGNAELKRTEEIGKGKGDTFVFGLSGAPAIAGTVAGVPAEKPPDDPARE